MTEKEVLKYKFIGHIALVFRLDGNSIAKLFNLDKEGLEDNLISVCSDMCSDSSKLKSFIYLFNRDIPGKSDEELVHNYRVARSFLVRFNNAEGEKRDKMIKELYQVEHDFDKICKKKFRGEVIGADDYISISKYRVRYGIALYTIAQTVGISRDTLSKNEKKYEDAKLKKEIENLNEYNLDYANASYDRARDRKEK